MKDKFVISGLFYKIGNYKLRKYLDIKHQSSSLTQPDLMVVMMNPGSSYPLDGIDNNDSPTEAKPDKTQNQIMKVMCISSFEYARVLNLSDLRTPSSNELYAFIESEESKDIPHSIFGRDREGDFSSLFVNNVPVIFSWGVSPILADLAKQAIKSVNHPNPIGLRKIQNQYAYYHPLQRTNRKQVEWVNEITNMLAG
jgi:hypothetical protein